MTNDILTNSPDEPFFPVTAETTTNQYINETPHHRNSVVIDVITNKYFNWYEKKFSEHYAKLELIKSDSTFCPEGTERPSEYAIEYAREIFNQLVNDELVPTIIVASAEGGVAICFMNKDKYADIECLNSGEILGVLSNKRDRPYVWEINQRSGDIAGATARISRFLEKNKA